MWGCVKDKVYATSVRGAEDMKSRIRDVITVLNIGMLARRREEVGLRLDVLRETWGAHTELRWVLKKNFMYVSIK
jgi:hypothetical protein